MLDILKPVEIANLRAVVLQGNKANPPAIAIICDDIGQLDMGWIERSGNLLKDVLASDKRVAPASWAATAYRALDETLGCVLPVFGFDALLDELSCYYWDGAGDDAGAREYLINYAGHGEDEIDEEMLPSAVKGKRPAWMLAKNAAPLKHLPKPLQEALRRLRDAAKAVRASGTEGNAWQFDSHLIGDYVDDYEDRTFLPPLTIVPFQIFAREIDDIARTGMEQGFMDIAGLCPLTNPGAIDAWIASLKLGVDFLLSAQALIDLDPANCET